MKKISLLFLVSALMLCCSKDETVPVLKLQSITNDVFGYAGGLGTIVMDSGGADIMAESSDPDWLRVQVRKNTVLFNVAGYTGDAERKAVITVTSGDIAPVMVTISQSRFVGLSVLVRSVELTNDRREQIVEVVSSGQYTVKITDDPGNVFSFRKVDEGVCFSTSHSQGNVAVYARATLIPEEEAAESVDITLCIPEKSMYDYILGTWNVDNIDNDSAASVTFTARVKPDSFNMYVNAEGIQNYPVLATFVNGQVTISSGQELGVSGDRYFSLHFNGPMNGSGTYIYTRPGYVAWAAEPVFDESSDRITLSFSDNGQGGSAQARTFAIWNCGGSYFNFGSGSPVVATDVLVLSRNYTE